MQTIPCECVDGTCKLPAMSHLGQLLGVCLCCGCGRGKLEKRSKRDAERNKSGQGLCWWQRLGCRDATARGALHHENCGWIRWSQLRQAAGGVEKAAEVTNKPKILVLIAPRFIEYTRPAQSPNRAKLKALVLLVAFIGSQPKLPTIAREGSEARSRGSGAPRLCAGAEPRRRATSAPNRAEVETDR